MALDRDIALLSSQALFSLFEHEALRLIAFASETRILRAGDVLFRHGEQSDGGYLVLSGTIALEAGDDGSPASHLAGRGSLIGEMALFAKGERPATAIARESSTVMRIPQSLMQRVLMEFPDSARAVQGALSSRAQGFAQKIARVRHKLIAIDAR